MSEVHNMREIENLEALVKSLEQSNERLKQSVVDLLQERVDDAVLMHKAADEIERLRAALEVTSSDCKEAFADNESLRLALEVAANDLDDWGAYTKANNARAALEGE